MINQNFVILGVLIGFAGNMVYVINTLKGRTRPNRVTWFMWTLAPFIAFAAQLHEGVGIQSLVTLMAGTCPLLVLIASFVNNKSVWKLTPFDFSCGALSIVGLVLWLLTRHGDIAIIFSIIADGLAATPTIRKAYTHPETEGWLNYLTAAISAGIALLTINDWNFATYGFPLYLLVVCVILSSLVRFRIGPRLRARP
ncbi:MAG TPA: hypothetical protein VN554_00195 [Verrucomicrobiae bacterium]|nr:hypothetical protein [Verrucomicrobiae bacterium]